MSDVDDSARGQSWLVLIELGSIPDEVAVRQRLAEAIAAAVEQEPTTRALDREAVIARPPARPDDGEVGRFTVRAPSRSAASAAAGAIQQTAVAKAFAHPADRNVGWTMSVDIQRVRHG